MKRSLDAYGSGQGGGGGGYGQRQPHHVTHELVDALNGARPFRGIWFIEDDERFRVPGASSSISIVRALDAGSPPRIPPARLSVTRDTLHLNDAGLIVSDDDLLDLTISFPTRSGHSVIFDPDLIERMFVQRNTDGLSRIRFRVAHIVDLIVKTVTT